MDNNLIPVIIPSYEPDEKLLALLHRLLEAGIEKVVIVDDGSTKEEYQQIFRQIETEFPYTVLHQAINMGKGRALKTAFNYCLVNYPEAIGCVTIDSDGQHTVKDMISCMEVLLSHPQALVLGVRNFNEDGIPARSVFGNKCTSRVMKMLVGVSVSDTQTGLRGIPAEFMQRLLLEKGERFEFETNMLLDTKQEEREIIEVPIETIYIEENKTSHFNPLKDSLRIYLVFFKFIAASLSSSVLDLIFFSLFCSLFANISIGKIGYIVIATVCARIISAAYNFMINYKVVFKSNSNKAKSLCKYIILAIGIMLCSGFLVEYLYTFCAGPEILVKIPVDVLLFLVSFFIQREFVYK